MIDTTARYRRPRAIRTASWALSLTEALAAREITPNQVSIFGLVAAIFGAGAILLSGLFESPTLRIAGFLVAGGCVALRMACSILDGMIAIETDGKTETGVLYNEIPDRLSDIAILVAFGYAIPEAEGLLLSGGTLGWAAALMALFVAYTRALGLACGAEHVFTGPLAGPQRLLTLLAACCLEIAALALGFRPPLLAISLWVVILGGFWTCSRRLRLIAESLATTPLVTLPLGKGRKTSAFADKNHV